MLIAHQNRESAIFASENFAMEEYIKFEIEDFGILFQYPEWWEHRVENRDTYLFWDEYVGSFRITPMRLKRGGPNLAQFLTEEQAKVAGSLTKQLGKHAYVYYESESVSETGDKTCMHYFLGGFGDVAILCSYAYSHTLLQDDFNREAAEAGLEEVEILLEGISFGEED
jgi:Domain of unknown function (DUF3805)